jgi:putative endonuclease
MKPQNYFVYITTNPDRHTVLYIGITNDLEFRLSQHSLNEGSAFAKQYNAAKLIYYETYPDPGSAIVREKQLKNGSRAKKEALIAKANPEWRDLILKMYATKNRHPERQSRDPVAPALR